MKENVTRQNCILRLQKEKELYKGELKTFEGELSKLTESDDKYKIRLLIDQIDETTKALSMVEKKLSEYGEHDE